jgi:hypothetical protein
VNDPRKKGRVPQVSLVLRDRGVVTCAASVVVVRFFVVRVARSSRMRSSPRSRNSGETWGTRQHGYLIRPGEVICFSCRQG